MIDTIVGWLDGHIPAGGLVVDLGAGTGALSAAILDALPDVRVQLVDVDPNMLQVADARCAAHDGRFDLRHARFEDQLPRCHAVVATLALHHVPTQDAKRGLYRSIHAALEPGGPVLVGDVLTYADGPELRGMKQAWYLHMAQHDITADQADEHWAQWAEEDVYMTLPDELALIADAGFPRPEIFWRDGLLTVYGGFKDRGPFDSDRAVRRHHVVHL